MLSGCHSCTLVVASSMEKGDEHQLLSTLESSYFDYLEFQALRA